MTRPTPTDRPAPAERASDTTRENPWPVRALAQRMTEYISRAPAAWVEGQVTQLNIRGGPTVFLTLRDPSVQMSLQVTCNRTTLGALARPLAEGDRVVVHGRFEFYPGRGSLSFRLDQLHPVGLGELLARLERLRELLRVEGLTAASRKKRLPFLPRVVGLITGKASAAESDVLANARARWPAVQFRVINTPVQGLSTVPQVIEALRILDADPAVEVIVLARGGGSVEDLLPFSDETLCRAVAACRTPVVSAIGHEPDHPLVDDVADMRCSTPTDAGKRVVPDAAAETAAVTALRGRARRALTGWVSTEQARLSGLTARSVLRDPHGPLTRRSDQIATMIAGTRRVILRQLDTQDSLAAHRRAQLSALGPAATLRRGYSVVQVDGHVIQRVDQAPAGAQLRIRVTDGAFLALGTGPEAPSSPAPKLSDRNVDE